ncbi:hypothetical protein DFJ73DRAFT_826193 [Zopfochytrium polystomum]|nr:hypothetical protein DFJ73DRAFT_826193 [Zopfochytrium polystomum]
MMHFGGEFKQRRGINLGGSSTARAAADRAELLRKAQAERQLRERERLRLRAAARIQAFVRGRWAAAAARAALRAEWDHIMDVGLLATATEAVLGRDDRALRRSAAAERISLATAMLVFFYREHIDGDRLASFCRCVTSVDPLVSDLPLLFVPFDSSCSRWPFRLRQFLSIVVKTLRDWDSSRMISDLEPECLTRVVSIAFSNDNWLKVRSSQSIRSSLMERSLADGVLVSVSSLVDSFSEKSTSNAISFLSSLLQEYEDYADREKFIKRLTELFCRPLLVVQAGSIWTPDVTKRLPLMELLLCIRNGDLKTILAVEDEPFVRCMLGLLSNLASMNMIEIVTELASDVSHYLLALERVMSLLPAHLSSAFETPASSPIDETSDDEDAEQESATNTIAPVTLSLITKTAFRDSIKQLVSESHVRTISRLSTRTNLGTVASYFNLVFRWWPSRKSAVLKILLYQVNSPLLLDGVEYLRGTLLWASSESRNSAEWTTLLNDSSNEQSWSMLAFLSELFSRLHLSMGDDEFFGSKNAAMIPHLVKLSAIGRNACFVLVWSRQFEKEVGQNRNFTSTIVSFIEQLYARDSRRPFCPKGHWLMVSETDADAFAQHAMVDKDDPISPGATRTVIESWQAVLDKIPFVIPFSSRVNILRSWISKDKATYGMEEVGWIQPRARVTIRRDRIIEDGFDQLNALGPALKRRVAITFVSDQGLVEAGIDGGGVFKEFLTELSKEVFSPKAGLFVSTTENLLYPSTQATNSEQFHQKLKYMEFVGRVVGKAIYEGILMDVGFAGFFLAKWLGRASYLDDLPSLDPVLYNGLLELKTHTGNVEEDFSLNFTSTEELMGRREEVELIPGGSALPVNNENRLEYIIRMADYKLNKRIRHQSAAFFSGLKDLIDPRWLRIFNQQELQMLLGGENTPIDIADLKRNVVYGGDFHEQHPTMRNFWEVVEEMSEENRRLLVKFVTSCARPPLMGFSELRPNFCIRQSVEAEDRLPTASTCVNLLKLPAYRDKETLKQKLNYAITYGAGFELS